MQIKDRIRELRKYLKLSGENFGKRIGVTRAAISRIETGANDLSDRNIKAICREFNVNEHWLRTGEGDMFVPLSREEEIAAFIGGMLKDQNDTFQKRFIRALSKLELEDWQRLERLVKDMINEQ